MSTPELEGRFSKIDEAIQRLAIVSADLSKMLAVQEHRLSQQEKNTDNITTMMERRRDDLDLKLKEVYHTMHDEDSVAVEEIKKLRIEQKIAIDSLETKVNNRSDVIETKVTRLEKLVLLATGAAMAFGFILGVVEKYHRFFLG